MHLSQCCNDFYLFMHLLRHGKAVQSCVEKKAKIVAEGKIANPLFEAVMNNMKRAARGAVTLDSLDIRWSRGCNAERDRLTRNWQY